MTTEAPTITIEAEKVILNEAAPPAGDVSPTAKTAAAENSWRNWKTGALAAGVLVLGGAIAHKMLSDDK